MLTHEYKCDHCGFFIAEPRHISVIDGIEYDFCTACHNDLKKFAKSVGRAPAVDWGQYATPLKPLKPLKQWPQPETGWLPYSVPDIQRPFVTYCRVDNATNTLS